MLIIYYYCLSIILQKELFFYKINKTYKCTYRNIKLAY